MNTLWHRSASAGMTALLIGALLSGCAGGSGVEQERAKDYAALSVAADSPESGTVAQNDAFSLEWDSEKKIVRIIDRATGKEYANSPDGLSGQIRYDEDGMVIKNSPQLESGVAISYYDSSTLEEKTLYSYVATEQNETVTAVKIDNGIRVLYDFAEESMFIPVDYTIQDDRFTVSVDPTEIRDGGINYVTGVAIAPFLCNVENDSPNSYLFIPDGSGAIIEPATTSKLGKTGSLAVYGGDRAVSQFAYAAHTEQCYMPVFGMKAGDSGLLGIIDSAAERSYIQWNVGSSNMRYSVVYPYFRVMGYNLIEQPPGFVRSSAETKVFNQTLHPERLSVSYYPLRGTACGYTEMAQRYREYLNKTYQLPQTAAKDTLVTLEIEGGAEEKRFFCGIPYQGFSRFTTVDQAQEIAAYFADTATDLRIRLSGFTESGLDTGKVAGGFKINRRLGTQADIRQLTEFCRQKNIVLSLDFNPLSLNKNGNGYSINRSSAFFADYSVNTLSLYNEVTRNAKGKKYFLLSRAAVPQVLSRITQSADDYGFDAVGLGTLGKTVYSDFRTAETANCDGIQENIHSVIEELARQKEVVLTGANDYAACVCDAISGAPVSSSGYDVVSYDVPFYSLVFKGYVPMSSGAVNLAADSNQALLRCVEAGISPTYSLIYNFTRDMVTSEYPVTASSSYTALRTTIQESIAKIKPVFEAINGAKITRHTAVNAELRIVEYDNRVRIYVNYGATDTRIGDVTVSAGDFTVIGGNSNP